MYGDFACTAAAAPVKSALPLEAPAESWDPKSITYVVGARNALPQLQRNLSTVLPHVDRAIVVDAFSEDGTPEYLKSFGSKVTLVQQEISANVQERHDFVMGLVRGGWVLYLSSRELPSQDLLDNLRGLVEASEDGQKFSKVEFKVHLVSFGETGPVEAPTTGYNLALFQTGSHGPGGSLARCDHPLYVVKV